MQPYQERVITERDELLEKISKLGTFFDSQVFLILSTRERYLLYRQNFYMKQYARILNERISAF